MYDKLISYSDANEKLLYEYQAFGAGYSTIYQMMHLPNHCSEATNKPNPDCIYTLDIFCDLSKALDVIN